MLFCFTGQYTPQALNAMRENPSTDRQAAVESVVKAAGGKLVAMYGHAVHGPGFMVIFDVPDPDMASAIAGVGVAGGAAQNVQLMRLFSMDEVKTIREKRARITSAYKPPGQA